MRVSTYALGDFDAHGGENLFGGLEVLNVLNALDVLDGFGGLASLGGLDVLVQKCSSRDNLHGVVRLEVLDGLEVCD